MSASSQDKPEKKTSFWESVTGVIVKVTGLIVAITGLVIAVRQFAGLGATKDKYPVDSTSMTTPPKQENDSIIREAQCQSRTDYIRSRNIITNGSDARIISGDAEIDSDDWTGVELAYTIEKINGDREIQITIKWYSQERNNNLSTGDTRIMSSKIFSLYKIDDCPELVIKNIRGLELQGSETNNFQGEVHNFVDFPDCGSLRNVNVRFDGSGSDDVPMQYLKAQMPHFSVELGPK